MWSRRDRTEASRRTLETASRLEILIRIAEALETSATLADQHAEREDSEAVWTPPPRSKTSPAERGHLRSRLARRRSADAKHHAVTRHRGPSSTPRSPGALGLACSSGSSENSWRSAARIMGHAAFV